jgi:tRNA (cmo5U34)-methyltransferase
VLVQPSGMDVSEEAGAGQYHFDPATYLTMTPAEVPAYRDLQHHVAEATRSIDAGSILDLGVGTGETASVVLTVHPAARLVGIDENGLC